MCGYNKFNIEGGIDGFGKSKSSGDCSSSQNVLHSLTMGSKHSHLTSLVFTLDFNTEKDKAQEKVSPER